MARGLRGVTQEFVNVGTYPEGLKGKLSIVHFVPFKTPIYLYISTFQVPMVLRGIEVERISSLLEVSLWTICSL
jgi:hypothetical protein